MPVPHNVKANVDFKPGRTFQTTDEAETIFLIPAGDAATQDLSALTANKHHYFWESRSYSYFRLEIVMPTGIGITTYSVKLFYYNPKTGKITVESTSLGTFTGDTVITGRTMGACIGFQIHSQNVIASDAVYECSLSLNNLKMETP